ncbi:MAG: TolC family protein [Chitinophagales bacterium]
MKKKLCKILVASILCLLFHSNLLIAQQINFDKIVVPTAQKPPTYEEKLVQLAWQNNPYHRSLEAEKKIAEQEKKLHQKDWLDGIHASFNLNEGNLSPQAPTNVFFPRYNVGATLKLGNFMKQKHKNNISEQEIMIAENRTNQQKLKIRAEVLRRYSAYQNALELLKINTNIANDAETYYTSIKLNFQTGLEPFKVYNEALQAYQNAEIVRLKTKQQLDNARITLEEIIGVNLDNIRY